jgi:uncharacterized phosphosugar-binding protein
MLDTYIQKLHHLIDQITTSQRNSIQMTAQLAADSIADGGVLHVFGSGHSHMIAEDIFHRAGGLACVNAMLEDSLMELNFGRATSLERLSGYAEVLLEGYSLKESEVILIISNSGINSVPIEIAMESKKRGLKVVAITSIEHSQKTASRHPSGKKLCDIAEIVIDNCGVFGDATIQPQGIKQKIGPTSTIGGIVIAQALIIEIIEQLLQRNIAPPVFISANQDEGDSNNKVLFERYKNQVRYS